MGSGVAVLTQHDFSSQKSNLQLQAAALRDRPLEFVPKAIALQNKTRKRCIPKKGYRYPSVNCLTFRWNV